MGDKRALWELMQETMQAFMPFYQVQMRQAIQDSPVPEQWFTLSLVHGSDPEPFTAERYHALSPYGVQERFVEVLDSLVEKEMLEKVDEKGYRLTEQGRQTVAGIFAAAHEGLGSFDPLPSADMERLNSLLKRVVKATLKAPEPAEKWDLLYSRWTDPGPEAAGSVKTDQYLTDLIRFRDDAHIAAWKPYGVSGAAWEALTFIWRGDASSAAELAERLQPYRAVSAEGYAKKLRGLAERGWIVEKDDAYELTEEGKRVREEAEEATDRHFFVGWTALSKEEKGELVDLLKRAKKGLLKTSLVQLRELIQETSRSIYPLTGDTVAGLFEQYNLIEPGMAFISRLVPDADARRAGGVCFNSLLRAHSLAPKPLSVALMGKLGPYGNPARYGELFDSLAEAGFLAATEDGGYKLTEKGSTTVEKVHHGFYTALGEIDVLSPEELTQLEGLLQRLAQACLEAPQPEKKPYITMVHRGHPTKDYAPLAKIDQHMDDINVFRDDAHVAAWKPYGVSGAAWEALTFIWRGEASGAEELVEKLPFRDHSAEVYSEALAELAEQGWVKKDDAGYSIAEKGAAVREEAEKQTDRYYYKPWKDLTTPERARLVVLLTNLKRDLQALAEDREEAS